MRTSIYYYIQCEWEFATVNTHTHSSHSHISFLFSQLIERERNSVILWKRLLVWNWKTHSGRHYTDLHTYDLHSIDHEFCLCSKLLYIILVFRCCYFCCCCHFLHGVIVPTYPIGSWAISMHTEWLRTPKCI